MAGLGAEAVDVDAQQAPGTRPALLERQLEYDARIDRHRGPGVLHHLALELARFPAGVAERDERIRWSLAARHRGEHIARGRDLNGVRNTMGVVPLAAGTMQHEAAI